MRILKNLLVAVILVVAIIVPFVIHHRTQTQLGANEITSQQHRDKIAKLVEQNQRLSNRVLQATISISKNDENVAELARLRTLIDNLRQKTNQLGKLQPESRRLAATQFLRELNINQLEHNKETAISATFPTKSGKLSDAMALTQAMQRFCKDHHGEFPSSLEAAVAYLPKPQNEEDSPFSPQLSGTNDFEVVYQGPQSDLVGIPPRRIALIRERQAWLSPEGRWSRTYGYADGTASIVESDDNFQSWEAQHIIPPPPGKL